MIIFLIQTKIFYVNNKVVLELKWAWTQRKVSGPIMKNDNAPLNIMVFFYLGVEGDFSLYFVPTSPAWQYVLYESSSGSKESFGVSFATIDSMV